MGGVFAGTGGTGAKPGLAGSVRNISADAIAAIVAGKGAAPQLAERVEAITLGSNGGNLLKYSELDLAANDDGGDPGYRRFRLQSYNTNQFVGAVMDPLRVDANKFVAATVTTPGSVNGFIDTNGNGTYDLGEVPLDGLIATKVFVTTAPTSFVPEALLTGAGFFDYDNKL
jgi:hypothetical protein